MIGTTISGVTFISVPGWVGTTQFSYMQMILGNLVGYFIIALILIPLYYRLNLTSIYTYLDTRFGFLSYKTGTFFFLLSRIIGCAFRLFLVANVLQIAVFDKWNIPFYVSVVITILLIWLYTNKGGIKTIVWINTFQTIVLLLAVIITICLISKHLNLGLSDMILTIQQSEFSRTFFVDDWNNQNYFFKQFFSGIFITIVMVGLDQAMMQKNLSCKNIKEAKKNIFSFSILFAIVNLFFLTLGALLYIFSNTKGISIPVRTDDLFPRIALNDLEPIVSIFFILGLISAAYSSADNELTALTTSFSIDFLNINKKDAQESVKTRKKVHILFSILLIIIILIFKAVNNESVISALFKIAGFTYGPLLGLFAFGLLTKFTIRDKYVLIPALLSPIICFFLNEYSEILFSGYKFGFEILIVNGILTFIGLLMIREKKK